MVLYDKQTPYFFSFLFLFSISLIEWMRLSDRILISQNKQPIGRYIINYSSTVSVSVRFQSDTIDTNATTFFKILFTEKRQLSIGTQFFIPVLHYSNHKMWVIFVGFLLLQYSAGISSSINRIPVIHNVSLEVFGYTPTTMNGTCDECLCAMLLNKTSISSFNCIQSNKTCELFSQALNTSLFSLINNTASSVYFITLPNNSSTLAITSTAQYTSSFFRESISPVPDEMSFHSEYDTGKKLLRRII